MYTDAGEELEVLLHDSTQAYFRYKTSIILELLLPLSKLCVYVFLKQKLVYFESLIKVWTLKNSRFN